MASFSASSCSRWPSDWSTTRAVSARTVLMRALGVGDARLGVDELVLAVGRGVVFFGERGAQFGGGGGGVGVALVGALELGDQRAVLLLEEAGALALGVELAEDGSPCRGCSRRSAPCRRARWSWAACRAALRARFRAARPCRHIRGRACAGAGRGRRLPSRDRGCGGAARPRAPRARASAAGACRARCGCEPTSVRLRLMSRSWSERRRRSASTFISSRRVESANSARS